MALVEHSALCRLVTGGKANALHEIARAAHLLAVAPTRKYTIRVINMFVFIVKTQGLILFFELLSRLLTISFEFSFLHFFIVVSISNNYSV